MNGFRHALSTSNDFPRVVLGVCGDAVRAAAELNDQAVVRELASQGDQACERLNERFETATFDLAVGEAWTLLGNRVAARARLARVRKAAKRYHYHELLLKAEATLDILESEQTVAPSPELRTDAWKDRSEDMLSGIHRLEILGVGA